jgi:hypothetical protein
MPGVHVPGFHVDALDRCRSIDHVDHQPAMRGGVRVDTIGIGKSQDAALLQALAGESGGLYQPL